MVIIEISPVLYFDAIPKMVIMLYQNIMWIDYWKFNKYYEFYAEKSEIELFEFWNVQHSV